MSNDIYLSTPGLRGSLSGDVFVGWLRTLLAYSFDLFFPAVELKKRISAQTLFAPSRWKPDIIFTGQT